MRGVKVLLLGACMLAFGAMWAQQKKEADKKAKPKPVPVYLGNSNYSNGDISKHIFDSLLTQGLTSHDSAGNRYKVDGYLLTYGERNLYEDSVGQLMVVTDYLSEVGYGDSLSSFLLSTLRDRSKKGDTVYFDQITVRDAAGKGFKGKGVKLVIQK